MSTTEDRNVALHYSESDTPLIFRFEARGRSRGVDIGFVSLSVRPPWLPVCPTASLSLSCRPSLKRVARRKPTRYPKEKEYLYAPLTGLVLIQLQVAASCLLVASFACLRWPVSFSFLLARSPSLHLGPAYFLEDKRSGFGRHQERARMHHLWQRRPLSPWGFKMRPW